MLNPVLRASRRAVTRALPSRPRVPAHHSATTTPPVSTATPITPARIFPLGIGGSVEGGGGGSPGGVCVLTCRSSARGLQRYPPAPPPPATRTPPPLPPTSAGRDTMSCP